jgi:hypothetical protein
MIDELTLADVETSCRAARSSSPRCCRGFDLNKGDLGSVKPNMTGDNNEQLCNVPYCLA